MKSELWKIKVGVFAAGLAFMGFAACGGGASARTVDVDYHLDEAAGSFLGYYPRNLTVTPGMTVKFHQTWTGEPHTVTLGTIIDKAVQPLRPLLNDYLSGAKPIPQEPPPEYDPALWEDKLPTLFSEQSDGLGQDAAMPCYIDKESELPLDNKACPKSKRVQPEFTGRQAYYSSGVIPFEGSDSNTFNLKIADDANEGTYFYYCNVHGILMSGNITVKKGAKVESQAALNRRGKEEADHTTKPLLAQYRKEVAGQGEFKGNLAGSGGTDETDSAEGIVDEFTPRTIETTAGKPVTWTFIGDHTISFNVPPYTPIFKITKGVFGFNEGLDKPKGGWPGAPQSADDQHDGPPPPPVHVDAGSWDGSAGLHSSGTGWNNGDTYTVTFTKKGTYPYACLIHPGMIGKVVVK